MTLSWASLYGYLNARLPSPPKFVTFLVNVEALTVMCSVDGNELATPLQFHEVEPLLAAFAPQLGMPEGATVINLCLIIDYVDNKANVVTFYRATNGRKQRTARDFKF